MDLTSFRRLSCFGCDRSRLRWRLDFTGSRGCDGPRSAISGSRPLLWRPKQFWFPGFQKFFHHRNTSVLEARVAWISVFWPLRTPFDIVLPLFRQLLVHPIRDTFVAFEGIFLKRIGLLVTLVECFVMYSAALGVHHIIPCLSEVFKRIFVLPKV